MRRVAFWTLLPFLVPQALWVRKTAPRFSDAAGPRNGCVGDGHVKHLVAIGDSIIAGVGAPTLDDALVGQTARALATSLGARVEWHSSGKTGQTSTGLMAHQLDGLPAIDADYVIVSIGVNDVTRVVRTRTYTRNIRAIARRIHEHYPGSIVGFAALPPLGVFPLLPQPLRAALGLRAQTFNEALSALLADVPGAIDIPVEFEASPGMFSDDGFHPSPLGYAEFGRAVADALIAAEASLAETSLAETSLAETHDGAAVEADLA